MTKKLALVFVIFLGALSAKAFDSTFLISGKLEGVKSGSMILDIFGANEQKI